MNELYLAKLSLTNFCNYKKHTFNFLNDRGEPYHYVCFFGPNGIGKSSLLEAISLLTMNQRGRRPDYVKRSLAKYIRNNNYDPSTNPVDLEAIQESEPSMFIEGTYLLDGKEYTVILSDCGWLRNDLIPIHPDAEAPEEIVATATMGPWGENYLRYVQRIAHFVSTDSDLSLNQFQLIKAWKPEFERIVSEIMRWPVECIQPTEIQNRKKSHNEYCTDVIIKKNELNIHFKRMSAGERKIIKSFSNLFNLMYDLAHPGDSSEQMLNWPRLLLLDNIEMHVYYDRHVRLIDSLKSVFREQQIFATTHSGVLISRFLKGENDHETELMIDLEKINTH